MNYYLDVLKKYAVFSGRARRKEYWMFVLCQFIIMLVLSLVGVQLLHNPATIYLVYGYALATLIPGLAVLGRRLHDTDHSAWWLLLCVVPLFVILEPFILVGLVEWIPNLSRINPSALFLVVAIPSLIAFVCTVALIIFAAMDSQPGDNQYGANPKGITAGVMENQQKMPMGMKVILIWLYIGFFGELTAIVINGGITNSYSFWGIPPVALVVLNLAANLVLIISIHTRKWWKASVTLLGIQLLITAGFFARMFSQPLEDIFLLSNKPLPAGIDPAQFGIMVKEFIVISVFGGIVLSLIIFIYVFKHRNYFDKN